MLKALAGNIVMLKECVMMSLRNIVSNRLRSFLTALGILIGMGFPKLLVELGGRALKKLLPDRREVRS